MKGLLLKDGYLIAKHCRVFLAIILVFTASIAFTGTGFYATYPLMLAALLPITVLSYDERSKWEVYANTLPISRRIVVAGKYALGLICVLAVLVLDAIALAVYALRNGLFTVAFYAPNLCLLFISGFLPMALMFPPMFRFGVEKG